MISNHEVEYERSSDTHPDEHVISIDADIFPVSVNPAPDLSFESATNTAFVTRRDIYSGLTKHKAAIRVSNQKQRHGNSKRATVTDEAVHPPPFTERVRASAKEEDEKDVEGHGEGPPGIRLHEPDSIVSN